jgi:hypothetical protein
VDGKDGTGGCAEFHFQSLIRALAIQRVEFL